MSTHIISGEAIRFPKIERLDSAAETGVRISTTVQNFETVRPLTDYASESLADFRRELDALARWAAVRRGCYSVTKRLIDVTLSLLALIILLPVFLLTAVAIKVYDRGPVLFSQERVGRAGRTFRCFKFRSMVLNAQELQSSLAAQSVHADPRTFKMANDPRITPVGKFLRRFSIDELPQILNVLLGAMSVVGPRPPLPHEVALYSAADFRRLTVKPGLTCLWQVSGRSRLPFPRQVELDVDYIRRRSLVLDVAIILKTIPAVLGGDGAS